MPGFRRRRSSRSGDVSRVSGTLNRAIDQHGQVIDVLASSKRDLAATRRFFARALDALRRPTEVTTDRAPAYPRVLDELVPEAWHGWSSTPTTRLKPITAG